LKTNWSLIVPLCDRSIIGGAEMAGKIAELRQAKIIRNATSRSKGRRGGTMPTGSGARLLQELVRPCERGVGIAKEPTQRRRSRRRRAQQREKAKQIVLRGQSSGR
jgi:hypothetical protein